MFRVNRFDMLTHIRGPLRYNGSLATRAAGFVADLPAEDRGRGLVAVDDEVYVGEVGGLGGVAGEEVGFCGGVGGGVGVDAAQIVVTV